MSSTTRVVITITDENDEAPKFTEKLYRRRIPSRPASETDVHLYRVVAYDLDTGANADIDYSITQGRGNGRFKINPKTGMISSQKDFESGSQYDLTVCIPCVISYFM